MVLGILEKGLSLDEVIFFDTGMEFKSIYNNRDKLKTILDRKGIKYTELKSGDHFLYNMFVRPVKYRKADDKPYPYHYGYEWCGNRCRWGTTDKTKTISSYYKEHYRNACVYEYVGIAADEPYRVKNDKHKIYPLVEWGMKESDCLKYCKENGWDWQENGVDLYDILDRVSCWCCQNKNLKELKNIYIFLPDYWQKLRGLQSRLDMPMKGKGKSVFELEERFKREIESERLQKI